MSAVADRLRADLTSALRAKEMATVRVLRTVLAAIANAEAIPVDRDQDPPGEGNGVIAGAASGLGAAEAARRELSEDDVRAIVAAERDDLLATADHLAATAPPGSAAADRAASLRAAATLLAPYL